MTCLNNINKKTFLWLINSYLLPTISFFCWVCFFNKTYFGDNLCFNLFIKILLFTLHFSLFVVLFIAKMKSKANLSKIITFLLAFLLILGLVFCFFGRKEFIGKLKSIEDVRECVLGRGNSAVLTFILIQFSQVVILPIPGLITTGAGALLFGPVRGAIYSYVGIILGSIVAYLIGCVLGQPVVKWLIGEANLDRCLSLVKGKRKFIIFTMFLIPFFPDDMLCFALGVSGVNFGLFLTVVLSCRFVTVFFSSFSMGNLIFLTNKGWGIFFLISLFLIVVVFFVLMIKHFRKKKNI